MASDIFVVTVVVKPTEIAITKAHDLSQIDLETVEDALHDRPLDVVITSNYNISITRNVLQCLQPNGWVEDNVISFYTHLLSDRDKYLVATRTLQRENYFFSLFFHPILAQNGYNDAGVCRWTLNVSVPAVLDNCGNHGYVQDNLFEKDKIFIPVHVNRARVAEMTCTRSVIIIITCFL
ncbi:hypothetical protein PHMEG_00036314 [Phytophthora megakarya]|uniref:Ubiquitin-like protease family profile domain-containing protein n=1 Tax=Phytophthora megakarya TaxID=4795 RepID=A0A225UND8_9STRA|nr:hypothetical protein PHMEG_00036314 [Phytophthora megakarya]